MKKLGKITINPEKVINNEELVNLRGGGYGLCTTICSSGLIIQKPYKCAWEECGNSLSSCDCDY
jgi:natural product precursor